MKLIFTLVVAPLIVEIVTTLFDHWLDGRHNKKR